MPSPDWIVQHRQQQLDAEQPSLANSSPLLDAGATDVIRKKASKMLTADNLRRVIQLPEGETEQDWITINLLEFFQHTMSLYATIADSCTPSTCPSMTAGSNYEFFWAQDGKKPIKVSAPHYVDLLRTWVISSLQDGQLIPQQPGEPFPKDFLFRIRTIYKRLFRIYAHMYHSHIHQIELLDERLVFDISCKHFIMFAKEFSLIDQNSMAPLSELISSYSI
ncbi:unnamed protein product [Umbelopsis sp. WA50703]